MNFSLYRSACISWTFTFCPLLLLRGLNGHSLTRKQFSYLRREGIRYWKNIKGNGMKMPHSSQIIDSKHRKIRTLNNSCSSFLSYVPYTRQRYAFCTSTFITSKSGKEENDSVNEKDNNRKHHDSEKLNHDNGRKPIKESSSVHPKEAHPTKSFFDKVDRDWEKAWENQLTPWDVGKAAPPLVSLLKNKTILPSITSKKSKVLIPGCGSGYELIAFAKAGFDHVEGVDISSTAIRIAEDKLEQIISADMTLSEEKKNDIRSRISLRVGDFFSLKGKYSIIFDYTFCVALPPTMRLDWAKQVKSLLDAENGELVTLIFPVPSQHNVLNSNFKELDVENGPPYDASPSLYSYLLEEENNMECIDLRSCLDSIKPRQGKEWIGRWRVRS